jgi:hypothetical protein
MRPIDLVQRGLAISIVALWLGAFAAALAPLVTPLP